MYYYTWMHVIAKICSESSLSDRTEFICRDASLYTQSTNKLSVTLWLVAISP